LGYNNTTLECNNNPWDIIIQLFEELYPEETQIKEERSCNNDLEDIQGILLLEALQAVDLRGNHHLPKLQLKTLSEGGESV
jgi:hypothetical protein